MSTKFDYDLFVIGAGSGGVRLARMAAAKGVRVAVAEDRYLGGTCVNVGCVPKKLFVYASETPEQLHDAQGFGWQLDGKLKFDWPTLLANKNKEISRLNGIYQSLLENPGVEIINGRARFVDANSVEVEGKTYTAERIVVATGSWPFVPEFEGAEHSITSNELFYIEQLPKAAVVLGGGYIAVEFAGILSGLGVDTTLVYRGDLFLRGFDQEVREFVRGEMEKKGVKLRFNDNIASIDKRADNELLVNLDSGDALEVGMVLCATGRRPHTQDLGLENTDVATNDKGEIVVNEHFETNVGSIYALGDVVGGMQLTPIALAEGMYLCSYLFDEQKPALVDYDNIPTAVFCQPNIATVGLSEEQARAAGHELDVYVSEFRALKHTVSGSDERTLMKMIVDKASQKVLGVHMAGHEAGEIIQGIAIALKAGATKQHFDQTIGIHPTAAEEFVTMRTVTRS